MTDGLQEDAVVREQAHLKNLEEAISALGAAILELKMNTGGTDSEKQLSELEARYSNLKSEFEAFEAAEREAGIPVGEPPRDAEGRIIPRLAAQGDEALVRAQKRMNEAFENLRAYATDERNTEAFKRNARDMGVAFADAWGEVSRGFERAFSRLRSGRQAEQIEEQKVEEENRK